MCLQLVWWGYSIVSLNNEIYLLKNDVVNQQKLPAQNYYNALTLARTKLDKRTSMVVGEGAIFLLLLALAFFQFRRILRRELKINEQQKNFLMAVTHELKSPIASARLQLDTVQKRTLTDVQKTTLLTNANNDLLRLTSLVDNILHATSIDNGQYPLTKNWCNASELIAALTANYELMYKQKIMFVTTIAPSLQLYADTQAITSIVTNLLDNAIKFSTINNTPQINITFTTNNDEIILRIEDNGIGISAAEKLHVFDKFYRVGNETTRQTKGSGLGLFIVKHLVQLHNGTITIHDVAPQGVAFVMIFT